MRFGTDVGLHEKVTGHCVDVAEAPFERAALTQKGTARGGSRTIRRGKRRAGRFSVTLRRWGGLSYARTRL